MWIEFLMDRVVSDYRKDTPAEERYTAGQIVDLPVASAEHWISRRAAKPVDDPKTARSVPPPSAVAPPPSSDGGIPAAGQTFAELPPERQPLPDLQKKIVPEPPKEKAKR